MTEIYKLMGSAVVAQIPNLDLFRFNYMFFQNNEKS